ncbi:cell division protein FtsZ [Salirhabdus euzebyi]|uniref:Cell division protein FtsZ n=1 Tax=Salirhabdus euzebyi TaxID=394506 RepID=A0A841Q5Y1_9BACI|nr:cell division protein FtsZ [Salirhabdus euzebyi]MBB6453816.1 cell division protein FtsZ [Salirhabdus euzebyi]
MMNDSITVYNVKHSEFKVKWNQQLNSMDKDDICFYRFVGGNLKETDELIQQLNTLKEKKALLLGVFRFPFRFEGKKRLQTAITQYFRMKELCDAIIFFHGDGMMDMIDSTTTVVEANRIFGSFEEIAIKALEEMVAIPGEMNIDVHDIRTFVKEKKGPLFLHTIEGDSFDEPLKYLISAPYLPENFTDGKQMILNIGYTQEVGMDAFRHINLRLNDLFNKADLVKLGTYFMDEPGNRFKITLLVNGIDDPFPQPDDLKRIPTPPLWLRRKWDIILQKSKNLKIFTQPKENNKEHGNSIEKEDKLHL